MNEPIQEYQTETKYKNKLCLCSVVKSCFKCIVKYCDYQKILKKVMIDTGQTVIKELHFKYGENHLLYVLYC